MITKEEFECELLPVKQSSFDEYLANSEGGTMEELIQMVNRETQLLNINADMDSIRFEVVNGSLVVYGKGIKIK